MNNTTMQNQHNASNSNATIIIASMNSTTGEYTASGSYRDSRDTIRAYSFEGSRGELMSDIERLRDADCDVTIRVYSKA